MPKPSVLGFTESIPALTLNEGMAFVQGMRRQLDRFDLAVPGMQGRQFPAEYEARIRVILDELEADIRAKQEGI